MSELHRRSRRLVLKSVKDRVMGFLASEVHSRSARMHPSSALLIMAALQVLANSLSPSVLNYSLDWNEHNSLREL